MAKNSDRGTIGGAIKAGSRSTYMKGRVSRQRSGKPVHKPAQKLAPFARTKVLKPLEVHFHFGNL